MNIVIPMAGHGQRFRDEGFDCPKALIPLFGRPCYATASDWLPFDYCDQLIYIILESDPYYNKLRTDILTRYGKYNPIVIGIPEVLRGSSETILAASEFINNDTPLLIHNSDTAVDISDDWLHDIQNIDGGLLVFESESNTSYSFSKEDELGNVIEVREKIPISEWASSGTYYFNKGSKFVELAESAIDSEEFENNEFYVAPLYNKLITEGGIVKNYKIDNVYQFGTPDELSTIINQSI